MEYFNLLTEINYLSFVGAFVKWILISLLLSIIVLIFATRYGLLKREKKVSRILVKLYYFVVPIYFILFAVKFAPIRNSQLQIIKIIERNETAVTNFASDFIGSVISDSMAYNTSSPKQLVNNYLENTIYTDSVKKELSGKRGQSLILNLKKKIEFSFLCKLLESKLIKEAADLIGIKKKTGKAIYRTSFHDLFHEGELVDLLTIEINAFFNKVYKSMLIVFAFGFVFPIGEILLAKKYRY